MRLASPSSPSALDLRRLSSVVSCNLLRCLRASFCVLASSSLGCQRRTKIENGTDSAATRSILQDRSSLQWKAPCAWESWNCYLLRHGEWRSDAVRLSWSLKIYHNSLSKVRYLDSGLLGCLTSLIAAKVPSIRGRIWFSCLCCWTTCAASANLNYFLIAPISGDSCCVGCFCDCRACLCASKTERIGLVVKLCSSLYLSNWILRSFVMVPWTNSILSSSWRKT